MVVVAVGDAVKDDLALGMMPVAVLKVITDAVFDWWEDATMRQIVCELRIAECSAGPFRRWS